jgi:NDP-sugar pyrophosphorylase family protein
MPIGEYPILEVLIRQLAHHDFKRITLAVNHQAEIIKAFCGDGSRWNVNLDYSLETKPLSTIGPLRLIPDLPEQFLLLNGDVLTDLDFAGFFTRHAASGAMYTISAHNRMHKIDYGVLNIDLNSRLTGFQEKPTASYLVSMGVYALSRKVLDLVPEGSPFGFDDLMLAMLNNKWPVQVEPHNGLWLDIGRPDDYSLAIDTFEQQRRKLLP